MWMLTFFCHFTNTPIPTQKKTNRSGVGWVEVMEELGKPMRQRRLLLVTPQTFALLDGPACSLVGTT